MSGRQADFSQVGAKPHLALRAKQQEREVDFERIGGRYKFGSIDHIRRCAEVVRQHEFILKHQRMIHHGKHRYVQLFKYRKLFHPH